MKNTNIAWCDYTWNPWRGCAKVSPGCEHCYAEGWGKRFGVEWGPGKPRRLASESLGQQFAFRLIGALFLGYLGARIFFSKPAEAPSKAEGKGLAGAYASTLFLTQTNPVTILAFAAIFAGLGLGNSGGDYTAGMLLVWGVFLGSAAWWLFLSTGVGLFRPWFNGPRLRWVNRLSGVIIGGFGFLAFLSLLQP